MDASVTTLKRPKYVIHLMDGETVKADHISFSEGGMWVSAFTQGISTRKCFTYLSAFNITRIEVNP